MIKYISDWFGRQFSNPQATILTLLLVLLFSIILLFGEILGPILAAVVIAYLLDDIVCKISKVTKIPRIFAVTIVFVMFLAFVLFVLMFIVPLASSQLAQFIGKAPSYIEFGKQQILELSQAYPAIFKSSFANDISENIARSMTEFSQDILGKTLSFIPGAVTVVIYIVMVPLLVLFLLKDKDKITSWIDKFLPQDYSLTAKVWHEVDYQLGNYVLGKFWEILIVGAATYACFVVFDLQYALLLAVIVGLSVLIPYIGATVVTIPVALIALFQFGLTPAFVYLILAYLVLQALDGYVLVPLLFSEAVDLHPVAIIGAILLFGGIWGFWGLFFAIPLAVLIAAVISAWPGELEPNSQA